MVVLSTLGFPPGRITDLRAFNAGRTSMELDWTAPAENANTGGRVEGYEVRYSESPIDPDNFSSATLVVDEVPPVPTDPGTTQSMAVNGLAPDKLYYFGIVATDVQGNTGPLSNVAALGTLEGTPPGAIADLTGRPSVESLAIVNGLTVADVSSERVSKGFVKENIVDGDTNTHWSSVGTEFPVTEFIIIDTGRDDIDIAVIRLRSDAGNGQRFPKDFLIQISDQRDQSFNTVATVTGFVAAPITWYEFDIPDTRGRFVKILATGENKYSKMFYSQIAEIEIVELAQATDGFVLEWTAPGDDGAVGMADTYDIRYWDQEIVDDDNFENNAMSVAPDHIAVIPSPRAAGTTETLVLGGFGLERVLWVAIKTRDDLGNVSGLSNVAMVSTPGNPPGTPTALQVVDPQATGSSIRLQWIAPPDNDGDNSSGPVADYDVRCSTSPIPGVATFEALAEIDFGATPIVGPGLTQIFDVPGLANGTNYHCSVLAVDQAGLKSGLPNPVQGGTLDEIAPNQVSNLQASFTVGGFSPVAVEVSGERTENGFFKENAIDGDLNTHWSTPGRSAITTEFYKLDFGSSQDINLVRLRSDSGNGQRFPKDFTIQVSADDVSYTVVHSENDFVAAPITWYEFSFPTVSARYVKIESTEQNKYRKKYYVQIAEIEILGPAGAAVQATLAWNATGDDGDQATAASYEIRYDTAEITGANFDGATLAASGLVPKSPGSLESFTFGGLLPATTYYFAIKTSDDAGNHSFSIISATTP